jgi:hypothetical protein
MGHEIAWVVHDSVHRVPGPQNVGLKNVFSAGPAPEVPDRDASIRGVAALQQLWDDWLVPMAIGMDGAVCNAIARFSPDAMLVDQQTIGAALRAHQMDLPWLTLASNPGELAIRRDQPSILEWTRGSVAKMAQQLSIGSVPEDALFSHFGCLIPSCPALMGSIPEGLLVHDVGCLTKHRQSPVARHDGSTPSRNILVTLGTLDHEARARVLQHALAAAHQLGPRTHWTIVDPGGFLGASDHEYITIEKRIRQIDLLPSMAAVVCHGGHNTIAEAMLFGVPVVVAPIRDDQPYIAQRIVEAGAGLRIRFAHATARHIADAVDRITTEPHFRHAAQRMSVELSGAEERVSALLAAWLSDPSRPLPPRPSASE